METTDYCSYELAKKLKERGFDEPCYAQWACEPDGKPVLVGSTALVFSRDDCKGRNLLAPTLWQAQKWLREKKRMFVNSFPERFDEDTGVKGIYKELLTGMWGYELWDDRNRSNPILEEVDGFHSYEQALSAGISASIDLLAGKEDEE